jgi:hypothetical protein
VPKRGKTVVLSIIVAVLGHPQERQARLRLEPDLARGTVGLLGGRELPLQALDLSLPVESAPRDALV